MAHVVLGFASSHGPTMKTRPQDWPRLEQKDREDPRFDFEALAARPHSVPEIELTPERREQHYEACQRGIHRTAEVLAEAAADVVIVLCNPHGIRDEEHQPVFGIYLGDSIPKLERDPDASRYGLRSGREASRIAPPPTVGTFPNNPELAGHLLDSLIADGFDVASLVRYPPGESIDNAFLAIYHLYEPTGTMPIVPFLISRYLPSQATANRCYDLGRHLRGAIERWDSDARVAIMASGGLSHQIVDEDFDRTVINAIVEKDEDQLRSLPRDRLNGAPGTPEILNWVTLAAAMEDEPMTLVDYVPCYRSAAGTGHGVTFGYWRSE